MRDWGYTVDAAESMAQALTMPRPDLILSDYRLGEVNDGMNLIAQLRARHGATIPAALVTADRSEAIETAANIAQVSLILKPAKPVRLRALLDSLVHKVGV